jgi:hypothetical protein
MSYMLSRLSVVDLSSQRQFSRRELWPSTASSDPELARDGVPEGLFHQRLPEVGVERGPRARRSCGIISWKVQACPARGA